MYIKSAWFQLKNWDAQARLGLAQLGKFQLELITRLITYVLKMIQIVWFQDYIVSMKS